MEHIINTNIDIFSHVLKKIPPKSILHIDKGSWDFSQTMSTPLKDILKFQIDENGADLHFLLSDECHKWFEHYLQTMTPSKWDFNMINFYRIYNYEKTDVYLLVYDINQYSISKKINISNSFIKQWEKDPNIYINIEDEIPYTEDFW